MKQVWSCALLKVTSRIRTHIFRLRVGRSSHWANPASRGHCANFANSGAERQYHSTCISLTVQLAVRLCEETVNGFRNYWLIEWLNELMLCKVFVVCPKFIQSVSSPTHVAKWNSPKILLPLQCLMDFGSSIALIYNYLIIYLMVCSCRSLEF